MSDIFFEELSLPNPTINLAICTTSPYQQLAEIIEKTGQYIVDDKPDVVCVWGDTNSSLGAAIAANKTHTMLCHIEAGCRSGDFRMAEEYNRILIDNLSDLLFPVAQCDSLNLTNEKIHGRITFLGDPLFDAFLYNRNRVLSNWIKTMSDFADFSILLTLHRAENVDSPVIIKRILKAINSIRSGKVLFPIHPRTRKMIEEFGLADLVDNEVVTTTEPLGYFEMLKILDQCDAVITDSGGLQKEAFFAQKTCITLRKSTEHLDTIRLKVNILIDPESESLDNLSEICSNAKKIGDTFKYISEMPYGDGHSSIQIVNAILDEISNNKTIIK
ncbi:MAG: UDP-N-acetylglucosamine 2-epimerase [Candidatus Nomurabacteria bacterium GW2011_GWB1_37_5]|uniref:UDP-N-acetylglucosamine 2-epimerase n=1 Tax=Candidatus Nomurabacteria bacterium GW2011_GWB1_37_5 TaxID=1618742 RepID=A0A0G0GVX0_9BACT|nr:MAG: UDP-N-acetylglucosamine 2-epimerase [Candidatus Nomurabacteria bacterium GW2011_GWB1_37_5]